MDPKTPQPPLMEKRNVVEDGRTPDDEFSRMDGDWDKQAAADFKPQDTERDSGENE